MMQITQNVEMKELPKEAALIRTMTPELNSEEVDQLRSTSPSQSRDITTVAQNGLRCPKTDGQESELTNGQGLKNTDKPHTNVASEQERNAGTDLDALLDKISSIVNRSPKDSNVHNECGDNDSDPIDENKPAPNREQDDTNIKPKTNVASENKASHSANNNVGDMLKITIENTSESLLLKSKDIIATAIAGQMEKSANGLEDSSFDEMFDKEKEAFASEATSKGSNDKATVHCQTRETDVIIDLDSSDEGMAEAITQLPQKETKLKKDDDKQLDKMWKTEEEYIRGKTRMSEANPVGFIEETGKLNTLLEATNVEEHVSNGLADQNKADINDGLKKKVEKEDDDKPEDVEITEGIEENLQKEDQEKPLEGEDDDDDVIFFELIDKSKGKEKNNEIEKKEKELETEGEREVAPVTVKKDVEIVLVSEDEEDDLQPMKKSSEKNEKEVALRTEKDFHADNSDNACDQFDKVKPQAKPKSSTNDHIDNNSNSSSLLRPAEYSDLPPLKRKRLTIETCSKVVEQAKGGIMIESEKPTLIKRGHNLVENSPSDLKKNQTPNKKLKTDDTDSNSSNDGTLQIDLDAKEEPDETTSPCKEDGEKYKLIPQPDYKAEVKPIRLEFVKTFRKSFDKMSRQDLEELVLQKVVEGMLVKSEFADIRRQIDKYEITIANYRRKIAEVSKQFVDLETVHKRVLKDLETKNSQFTAPVRITRAVGLQVGISIKAAKPDLQTAAQSNVAISSTSLPTGTVSKASTSPLRSPLRGGVQTVRPPHQHQQTQQNQQQPRPSLLPSSSLASSSSFAKTLQPASGTTPVRRGCMQKVTPQRPGPGHHIAQTTTASSTPANRSSQAGRSSQSVHVSKHTGGNSSGGSVGTPVGASSTSAAIRARSGTSPYANMNQKQQQSHQYQTSRTGPGSSPNKLPVKIPGKARSLPTVSVPISAAAGGSPPNLAPAKPKDKSVIDLTDEDEAAAAAAAIQSRLSQSASVTMKKSAGQGAGPGTGLVRAGSSSTAGNVVRVSPMPGPTCRTNVVSRISGGGQRNSLGSNVTMQIRSENIPPSASRLRYSHPAPLPSSPAQPFNPAWKLPPSRPVIRISLHDTGIVISWTLEDTSNRFADCVTYQIYAYQETIHEPSTDSWRHVGDVKAMLLPMAVTLNQFQENQRYYFAVRGVDEHQRFGPFSLPKTWS